MQKFFSKLLMYLSLIVLAFVILFPLLVVFNTSFMSEAEYNNYEGWGFAQSYLNFENYRLAYEQGDLKLAFMITFIIILISNLGSVFLGSGLAYFLNRFEFRFKKLTIILFYLVMAMPIVILQITTFKVMVTLHLYNTIWALILLYIGVDIIMLYIYLQNLEQIPYELDEAAKLEGASYFQIYHFILFPLLKPATITVVVLKTISIYNDFYLPYLYMPSNKLPTIATSIYRFVGPSQTSWQVISALLIITMIPMVLLYVFLNKQIDKGLVQGSVKE